jgi:hypothetical protein
MLNIGTSLISKRHPNRPGLASAPPMKTTYGSNLGNLR